MTNEDFLLKNGIYVASCSTVRVVDQVAQCVPRRAYAKLCVSFLMSCPTDSWCSNQTCVAAVEGGESFRADTGDL